MPALSPLRFRKAYPRIKKAVLFGRLLVSIAFSSCLLFKPFPLLSLQRFRLLTAWETEPIRVSIGCSSLYLGVRLVVLDINQFYREKASQTCNPELVLGVVGGYSQVWLLDWALGLLGRIEPGEFVPSHLSRLINWCNRGAT